MQEGIIIRKKKRKEKYQEKKKKEMILRPGVKIYKEVWLDKAF